MSGNLVTTTVFACAMGLATPALAAESEPDTKARILELAPRLDQYIETGMKAYDLPGLAIGIVVDDELVYAKGFGVRAKDGTEQVSPNTVFQIASTSKAILTATMAIAADRGKLDWNARIVDLVPDFQLKDPWVTREFRVFDVTAQRSGLPPSANDTLVFLGHNAEAMVHSLRNVDLVDSFRANFTYTNITHILAGTLVANALEASDWQTVLQRKIFDPLGMKNSSYSQAAIEAAPDHASGHRFTLDGSVKIPFTWIPYHWGGAGGINSTITDMAPWLTLQLNNGTFKGKKEDSQCRKPCRHPHRACGRQCEHQLRHGLAQY